MSFKIPLFDLNFNEKEEHAVIEVLRSKWISTGPTAQKFEKQFANMVNANYALTTSNCTVGLHMALILAEVKPGDEVICPSLTFVATVNAIRYVGAKPIFVDIQSYDVLTIDPNEIESKITARTSAIIVMHFGGFACNMDAINIIAKNNDLKIIEDACHGPLSEYNGKKLGSIGDIGCFSFFSNKNISTGEGGMLVTNQESIYEKAKLLRSHGMTSMSYERAKGHATNYDVVDLGFNYRMDDIRCAIGLAQLEKLENDIKKRIEIRKLYIKYLKDIEGIIIPFKNNDEFSSNYIFTIVLENSDFNKRDGVRNSLVEYGIQTSVHYPAVHLFTIYEEFYLKLPKTEYVSDNLITLPMYSKLKEEDIKYIADALYTILTHEK